MSLTTQNQRYAMLRVFTPTWLSDETIVVPTTPTVAVSVTDDDVTVTFTGFDVGSISYIEVYNKYTLVRIGEYNDGGSGSLTILGMDPGFYIGIGRSEDPGSNCPSEPADPVDWEIADSLLSQPQQYRVIGTQENPSDPMKRVLVLEAVEKPIRPNG